MIGTVNCIYETPCGWCSKWNRKCDKKITEEVTNTDSNVICAEDSHDWEWVSSSTVGTVYQCKNCHVQRVDTNPLTSRIDAIPLDIPITIAYLKK